MGDERADQIFTEPPYNVPHRRSRERAWEDDAPRIRHGFGRDESRPSSRPFCARLCRMRTRLKGRRHPLCLHGLAAHGRGAQWGRGGLFGAEEPLRLEQDNGGMGSLYRSKHEFVFVFKMGRARTPTLWSSATRALPDERLGLRRGEHLPGTGRVSMHPTVKPVALVADAIRDCSKRGETCSTPLADPALR